MLKTIKHKAGFSNAGPVAGSHQTNSPQIIDDKADFSDAESDASQITPFKAINGEGDIRNDDFETDNTFQTTSFKAVNAEAGFIDAELDAENPHTNAPQTVSGETESVAENPQIFDNDGYAGDFDSETETESCLTTNDEAGFDPSMKATAREPANFQARDAAVILTGMKRSSTVVLEEATETKRRRTGRGSLSLTNETERQRMKRLWAWYQAERGDDIASEIIEMLDKDDGEDLLSFIFQRGAIRDKPKFRAAFIPDP
ncbi:hypothetical protein MMC25_007327 [Agyrium rufum]|nr:hypothetical protein [Agyrium rufum]